MAKKIKQTDTTERLPWRKTWISHELKEDGPFTKMHYACAKLIEAMRPGCAEWHAVQNDMCINTPRQPHTERVLETRRYWERPEKLTPFKDWVPVSYEDHFAHGFEKDEEFYIGKEKFKVVERSVPNARGEGTVMVRRGGK